MLSLDSKLSIEASPQFAKIKNITQPTYWYDTLNPKEINWSRPEEMVESNVNYYANIQ